MRGRIGGPKESLATRDPLLPLIDVAESAEPLDRDRDVLRRGNDDVDVDDRLGGHAGYGRAADVVNLRSEIGNHLADGGGKFFEERRPPSS
jgi:hypothetical protein